MPYNFRITTQIQKQVSFLQHRRKLLSKKRNKSNVSKPQKIKRKVKNRKEKQITQNKNEPSKIISTKHHIKTKRLRKLKTQLVTLLPPFNKNFLSRDNKDQIIGIDYILDGLEAPQMIQF